MQLPKALVILSISYSVMGCAQGPKPTICISSPETNEFRCYDYENSKYSSKTLEAVDSWVCLNPTDFKNTLEACKRKMAGPLVNACIASASDRSFHCYDEITEKLNLITYLLTDNYVCMAGSDEQQLLNYCKDIRRK